MLLRRCPAAVNLGQTKYFHRSSGVPLSIRRRVGRERAFFHIWKCVFLLFLFSNFLCQIMYISLSHLSLLWHVQTLTICIISVICPPFLVLTSFLTLQFNACEFLNWILLRTPWTSPSSRVTGTAPSSLWLTDEARKLCFNSHTSLGSGLWSLYQATSLWTFWHTLSCSHMHVSYPLFIFSH